MSSKRRNPRSIRLSEKLEAAVETQATLADRSFSWLVAKALQEYLDRQQQNQGGDQIHSEVEDLKAQIATMRRQIETMSAGVQFNAGISAPKVNQRMQPNYQAQVDQTRSGYVSAAAAIDDLF